MTCSILFKIIHHGQFMTTSDHKDKKPAPGGDSNPEVPGGGKPPEGSEGDGSKSGKNNDNPSKDSKGTGSRSIM